MCVSINSFHVLSGNLLTLSFGASSGWATINFIDLQQENTTFPTGPLSLEEATFVTSIVSIGGFVGNFAILPVSNKVGVKRAIHFMGIPLIVCLTVKIHFKLSS